MFFCMHGSQSPKNAKVQVDIDVRAFRQSSTMGNGHLEILMMRGLSKWQPYIIKGSRSGFQKQLPYAALFHD